MNKKILLLLFAFLLDGCTIENLDIDDNRQTSNAQIGLK